VLEGVEEDCVERGYLLIPVWLEQMGRGDYEAGRGAAVEAAEIGERFGDRDLLSLARDDQGSLRPPGGSRRPSRRCRPELIWGR